MYKFAQKNWFWLIPAIVAIVAYIALAKKGAIKTPAFFAKTPGTGLDRTVVLYNGIQGKDAEVAELQKILNQRGAVPALVVDGKFGPKTAQELHKQKGVWQVSLSAL